MSGYTTLPSTATAFIHIYGAEPSVKVKCLLKKLILKGIRASEPPFWEMNQALEHLPSPHELTTPDHHRL